MAGVKAPALRDAIANVSSPGFFWDRAEAIRFTDLDRCSSFKRGTGFGGQLTELAGRSVLVATGNQLTAAAALIELDGIVRRLVILPPDAEVDHLGAIIAMAGIDAVVVDAATAPNAALDLPIRVVGALPIEPVSDEQLPRTRTEWVLMTSGTTGMPKMVVHDFAGLTAAMRASSPADGATVWGTFYDIRRYGGLQIYFRAICGGASLVLSSAAEPVADHLRRLAEHGVTHISGTPSQWRRALMIPEIRAIAPRYVRLSGEIADQAILDGLRATFPQAAIGHAYASTEAGVAFDVNDGLAGFPAAYVGTTRDGVDVKISDGSLRIRSAAPRRLPGRRCGTRRRRWLRRHRRHRRAAWRPLLFCRPQGRHHQCRRIEGSSGGDRGCDQPPSAGADVAGAVEAKPDHRRDRGRRCGTQGGRAGRAADRTDKDDILKLCRQALPRHKVPAAISFVPALTVAATGKLLRR